MKKSQLIAVVALGVLQGCYMLLDGIHQLATGSYLGGQLGPWVRIASWVGIKPDAVAPVFIAAGLLWLAGVVALVFRMRWARVLLAIMGVITLAYPLFGTLFSVLVLLLLFVGKNLYPAAEVRL